MLIYVKNNARDGGINKSMFYVDVLCRCFMSMFFAWADNRGI